DDEGCLHAHAAAGPSGGAPGRRPATDQLAHHRPRRTMTHVAPITLLPDSAPEQPPSSKPGVGLYGRSATGFRAATDGRARALIAELDHRVRPGDRLRYALYCPYDPTAPTVEDGCAATATGIELILDDGSTVGGELLRDDHGVPVDPAAQFAARTSAPDQWNHKVVDLTPLTGRTVTGLALLVDVSALPTPGERTVHG